jgi:hypothetical protein
MSLQERARRLQATRSNGGSRTFSPARGGTRTPVTRRGSGAYASRSRSPVGSAASASLRGSSGGAAGQRSGSPARRGLERVQQMKARRDFSPRRGGGGGGGGASALDSSLRRYSGGGSQRASIGSRRQPSLGGAGGGLRSEAMERLRGGGGGGGATLKADDLGRVESPGRSAKNPQELVAFLRTQRAASAERRRQSLGAGSFSAGGVGGGDRGPGAPPVHSRLSARAPSAAASRSVSPQGVAPAAAATRGVAQDVHRLFEANNVDIVDAFEAFDDNNDGCVDPGEFRRGLHGLHIGISDAQIDQLLDLVDRNHDGEIDYYEFAQEIFGVSAAKAAGLSLEHKARSADEKERRKREVMRAAQQRASLHPVTDALVHGQDVFEQQPGAGAGGYPAPAVRQISASALQSRGVNHLDTWLSQLNEHEKQSHVQPLDATQGAHTYHHLREMSGVAVILNCPPSFT